MFSLYANIRGVLENGDVLFIDELRARLRPLLHMNILLSFLSPDINRKHAPLIVTAHDAALLKFDYLRREEMWLAQKDSHEESTLFSFVEFKDIKQLRGKNNRSLIKNNLIGKLGGVASVSPISFQEDKRRSGNLVIHESDVLRHTRFFLLKNARPNP